MSLTDDVENIFYIRKVITECFDHERFQDIHRGTKLHVVRVETLVEMLQESVFQLSTRELSISIGCHLDRFTYNSPKANEENGAASIEVTSARSRHDRMVKLDFRCVPYSYNSFDVLVSGTAACRGAGKRRQATRNFALSEYNCSRH